MLLFNGLYPMDQVLTSAGVFNHRGISRVIHFEEDAQATITVEEVADTRGDWRSISLNGVNVAGTSIGSITGGLLAAAWGTSFSAALVSGSAALLHVASNQGNVQEATDPYRAAYAFDTSAYTPNQTPYTDEWGKGILDAYQAAVNELGGGGGKINRKSTIL